jgi:hypothetical protein
VTEDGATAAFATHNYYLHGLYTVLSCEATEQSMQRLRTICDVDNRMKGALWPISVMYTSDSHSLFLQPSSSGVGAGPDLLVLLSDTTGTSNAGFLMC